MVFIAVAVYFCFALYWAIAGIMGSISNISSSYVYEQLLEGPSWWLVLYYSGEGVAGTVSLVIRSIGGFFALYAATLLLKKREAALPLIKGENWRCLAF